MFLVTASIINYRSIRDLTINFNQLTRLIGSNGAGKSTILKAIGLFYASGTQTLTNDDFFNRDIQGNIEITLTFGSFTTAERTQFGSHINNSDQMVVTRIFSLTNSNLNGKYFGLTRRFPGFNTIRNAVNATEKRNLYNAFRVDHPELPTIRSAGQVDEAMLAWEAEHFNQLVVSRDDGQFFGFTNVAQGRLQNSTMFVYVPAVRDAFGDSVEGRGTAITRLLDLVVRSAIETRADMQQFRTEFQNRYRQITNPTNLVELGELSNVLTNTLQNFYQNTAVVLNWNQANDISIPLPTADIRMDDDGYRTTVDRTGHGLQRALILTLLQHLALESVAQQISDDDHVTEQEEAMGELEQQLPSLILAIEEPEIYQHPTKQRHFARVLERISTGSLPGVTANTQVIFASHSPLFVSMERFDEIRLFQRRQINAGEPRETVMNFATLQQVASALETAFRRTSGSFTASNLRPRLHIIDSDVAEGFFSTLVVIVEGASDKAALRATSDYMHIDFEAREISIVVAHGKSNIDKCVAVFRALHIPFFIIWDNDRRANGIEGIECNRALQRLVGVAEAQLLDSVQRVATNYACFEDKLETTLQNEIGEERFNRILGTCVVEFGVSNRDDAQKVPQIMERLLAIAANENARSATLESIVTAIVNLRNTIG